MMIRSLLVVLFVAGVVQTGAGQVQPVEVQHHPDAAADVLWAEAGSRHGIYWNGSALLFASDDGFRRIRLDGTLMAGETSDSGARIAILLKRAPGEPLQLRVFAGDGSLEMESEVPHHRDDPLPQLALSDVSSQVVYTRPATAEVCFVGMGGTECARLFKDADYSLERNVVVDISHDGRHVAVAAQREAAHPQLAAAGGNAFLFMFDRHGSLLRRTRLSQPAVRALAFAPRSLVAVSTYDAYSEAEVLQRTRVLTTDGETQADVPQGADSFVFSDQEMLLITARRVTAVDVSDGTSRVVHSVDAGRHVISAAVGEGGTKSVVLTGRRDYTGGGFVFKDLRLLHLDAAGAAVGDNVVAATPQRAPRVSVNPARRQTALILDRETHLYSWPQ